MDPPADLINFTIALISPVSRRETQNAGRTANRAGIAFAAIPENLMATATGKRKKKATKRVKRSASKKSTPKKKWSKRVMQTSDALDLKSKIFTSKDPKKIARSLKRSAERSKRRKAGPFQSAMSMLNFYINRAGKNMTAGEKKPLEKAKDELRTLFGKKETKK